MTDRIDNNTFAATDSFFQKCCELAGIKPCGRQASKFRNQKGAAHQYRNKAKEALKKEESEKK
jgi:hypothetical protein